VFLLTDLKARARTVVFSLTAKVFSFFQVNCPDIPHASLACEVAPVDENAALYEFASSCRKAKASIVHFQLRHLVHAVSSRDVFFSAAGQHGICHWDAVTRTQRLALPVEADVQISTCAAWPTGTGEQNYIVAAGGFAGELIVRSVPLCDGAAELEGNTRTQSTGIGVGQQRIMTGSAATGGLGSGGTSAVFARRISTDENAITNAIVYAPSLGAGGAPGVVASNNDCVVRAFDGTAMRENGRFPFPWAVNYTAVSPCGRLAIVVGDSTTCALLDLTSAQVVAHLAGHLDFSFAASWHPDGSCFATGSQDATARIWDIRRLATARRVLQGKLGAIRSLCFSHDGAALAAAEPADFVHVYDCGADFRRSQVVDLFGEIAGIDFSPCSETLFVSVADLTYGSLMEFKRTRPHRKRLSLL